MGLFDRLRKMKKKGPKKPIIEPKPKAETPERFEVPIPEAPQERPKKKRRAISLNTPGDLNKIKDELQADVAALSEKDSQLDLRRKDLERKVAGATEELDKLRKKIISDSLIDSSVSTGLADHEKKRDELVSEMKDAKVKRDTYQKELKSLNERLATTSSKTKADVRKLLARKEKVQKEVGILETAINALNKKVDDLSVNVAFERSQLEDMRQKKSTVKGEISTLETTKLYLEQQIAEQNDLVNELHREADDLVTKITQKKKVEGGITALKRQRTYLDKQIKGLDAKQANLMASVKELEFRLNQETSRDSKLQNEVKSLENKKRLLNEEIQRLRGKHDNLLDTLSQK